MQTRLFLNKTANLIRPNAYRILSVDKTPTFLKTDTFQYNNN